MIEFFHTNELAIYGLAIFSLITFVGTLIIVPMLVVRIPADYFLYKKRHKAPWASQHPLIRVIFIAGKNLLGYILVVMGIVMLMIPGQGILTIVIGLILVDFPGKYRLERWVIRHQSVLRSINWFRRRANRNPIVLD